MKKLTLILILIWSFSLTACSSKDEAANVFLKEYAAVSAEVAEKLDEGKIDEARQIFESKKASLNEKYDAVKTSLPTQLSAETKKRINAEPEQNMIDLTASANKAIKKNPNSEAKVQALVLEFANVFRR